MQYFTGQLLDCRRIVLPGDRMKYKRSVFTIVIITVLATVGVLLIYVNLTPNSPKISVIPAPDYDVRSAQFRREMSSLFGQELIPGNEITTLQNGVEIFPAMLEAIRGAEQSVNLETFVYWQGDIAVEFADALAERARNGVVVNVILDWVGSRAMDDTLVDQMEEAGVNVVRFRPLNWYSVDRVNHRTHRKILVVDGKIGFTGGVGIAEEWTGDAQDAEHFRDSHYRLTGVAARQMQAAFVENWQKSKGEILHGVKYFPPLQPTGEVVAQVVNSAPGTGGESARAMYLMAIAAARETLYIGSAYFVPDDLLVEALQAADERGVDVQILVPGEEIDTQLTRRASRAKWGPLLRSNVEIYEYKPTLYHTKVMVVDGYLSMVGSTNFDARSFRLNDEINLNVLDEDFAQTQIEAFRKDLEQTDTITYEQWKNRPLSEKLMEPFALMVSSQL